MSGLCTNSVGDKVWSFSGFSASCELSATSVGDGVLSSVLLCSVLGFGCIHEVTSEKTEASFNCFGGMAAKVKARAAHTRFELKMSTDPMGDDLDTSQEALDWNVGHKVCKGTSASKTFLKTRARDAMTQVF